MQMKEGFSSKFAGFLQGWGVVCVGAVGVTTKGERPAGNRV